MLPVLLAGLVAGLGVVMVIRGVVPDRVPLALGVARLTETPPPVAAGSLRRVGSWLLAMSTALGVSTGALARDLRVAGSTPERLAVEKVVSAWLMAVFPIGAAALATAGGVALAWPLVVLASLVLAVIGFLTPDLALRSRARERRREFRHVLTSYLDVVTIVIAGGGGVETALYDAAGAGTSWPHAELRRVLDGCRLAGEAPWTALGRLGDQLGVEELGELAASIGLAGEHGAKVRLSLDAKAASMRQHQLSEMEAEAQAATEKMSIPVVLMLFGFLVFVGYPAVARVVGGL